MGFSNLAAFGKLASSFESSVNLWGSQTQVPRERHIYAFESSVNLWGSQTEAKEELAAATFESSVNLWGSQTKNRCELPQRNAVKRGNHRRADENGGGYGECPRRR